jgi:hypothetical protein
MQMSRRLIASKSWWYLAADFGDPRAAPDAPRKCKAELKREKKNIAPRK